MNRYTPVKVRISVWEEISKMSSRGRSQSRERIVIKSSEYNSGEALDPLKFLADLIGGLTNLDVGLSVVLTDGEKSVSYGLSTFISKNYEIEHGKVKFGYRRLNLDTLRAKITYEIYVSSDAADNSDSGESSNA